MFSNKEGSPDIPIDDVEFPKEEPPNFDDGCVVEDFNKEEVTKFDLGMKIKIILSFFANTLTFF